MLFEMQYFDCIQILPRYTPFIQINQILPKFAQILPTLAEIWPKFA